MSIATDNFGNPILEQFSADGFIDCILKISDLVEGQDFFNFHLSASSDELVVGMDVVLRKDIRAGFDSEVKLIGDHVCRKGVTFIRSGTKSDRLISRLAVLYGLPRTNAEMISQETFTAIALHQGEIDIRSQAVKIKIFGRDGEPFDESAYYESFFYVDLAKGIVCWNEKDPDYREPLIRGLTRQS